MTSTWTTIHLARASLKLGHDVIFIEPWDFSVDSSRGLRARGAFFSGPPPSAAQMVAKLTTRQHRRKMVDISSLDMLMIRAAPLDTTILTFCLIAESEGVSVVNAPRGALAVSHKAWLPTLVDAPIPATLVTRSHGAATTFFEVLDRDVIVKPARGSGGESVHRVAAGDHEDFLHATETTAARGDGYVVIQAYMPRADEGEVRVVVVDGSPLCAYLRTKDEGAVVHNLRQGGTAKAVEITVEQVSSLEKLRAPLLALGIRFAGVDMIGHEVVEVNALNPGGVFHADRLNGTDYGCEVISRLTRKL